MTPRIRALVAMLATLGAVAAAPAVASAATFTVTNNSDSGAGSLRDAVARANSTPGSTIVVPTGTYTLQTGELDLTANMLITGAGSGSGGTVIDAGNASRAFNVGADATVEIDGVSIVNGNPAGLTADTCGVGVGSGGAILDGGTLTLKDDSIANSISVGPGGGIDDIGTGALTISGTVISGNTACEGDGASGDGGGVAEEGSGTVSISDSTVSGNSAVWGGGVAAEGQSPAGGSGQVQLTGDTLTGNVGGDLNRDQQFGGGGGLYVNGDTVDVLNSTITGNTGWDGGGATSAGGSTTFSFSTIVDNTAKDPEPGIGIGNLMDDQDGQGTVFTLDDTIVAAGAGADPAQAAQDTASPPSNCGPIFAGGFQSNGHNLFDDNTDSQCGSGTGDVIDSGILLADLANNGGPTETMALKAGSPAIDAADDAACARETGGVDQRGDKRPGDGKHCDIGAFEYSPPAPAVPTPNPPATSTSTPQTQATTTNTTTPSADLALSKRASERSVLVGSKLTYTLSATNHGPSADTGVTIADRLPAALTLVSDPASCHGRVAITCSVGSLAVGARATVKLTVRADRVGTVINTATTAGAVTDPDAKNNRASARVRVRPLPSCVGLMLNDRIDPDDLVPIAQVYVDGRLVRTLHGHDLRHVRVQAPQGLTSFALRVVFRADDLRDAIATTRVRGCHIGPVSWQWLALPGALNES